MLKYCRLFLFTLFFTHVITIHCEQNDKPLNIAIVGLGGRAQWLIMECLKLNPDIHVVAICDDNAKNCIQYHIDRLNTQNKDLLPVYSKALNNALIYKNTDQDLRKLLKDNNNIDVIFLTSPNYDHLWHLDTILECCPNKRIFMEKPLYKTLEEFNKFDFEKTKNKDITIGLTLRYSSMANIVVQQLKVHQKVLGNLKSVKVWEHLNFPHALTAFIMGWRRYISLSGGLLLEKCIHDLDLSLFFIDAVGVKPTNISISTERANKFYIKSHKSEILEHILHNEKLLQKFESTKIKMWEPFNFIRSLKGNVDWIATMDNIFAEYPDNDDFANLDIIPDYHKLSATFEDTKKHTVNFELEVNTGGFRSETVRGQLLTFEYGEVLIDIMASKMRITFNDNKTYEYDLKTNNNDHADGDSYIIHAILGYPQPQGYYRATINDPIVKLSNFMALISQEQALKHQIKTVIKKLDQNWLLN